MSIDTNEVKSLFASKTFWTNVIAMVIGGFAITGHALPPEIASPEAQAETLTVITGLVNVVLRLITSQPVSITGR